MTLEYLIGGQEVVGSDPLFSMAGPGRPHPKLYRPKSWNTAHGIGPNFGGKAHGK